MLYGICNALQEAVRVFRWLEELLWSVMHFKNGKAGLTYESEQMVALFIGREGDVSTAPVLYDRL